MGPGAKSVAVASGVQRRRFLGRGYRRCLLRYVAPQVLQAIEVARLGREDVEDDVEVVGDDPRCLRLACRGARQQTLLVLEPSVHLVPDRLRLARVRAGGDDEEV